MPLRTDAQGVLIKIKVQPKASQNQIVGLLDGALKIRLTAPPVDGKANQACLKFLAETLGVSRSQLELVSGLTGRQKTIRVQGLTESQIRAILLQAN